MRIMRCGKTKVTRLVGASLHVREEVCTYTSTWSEMPSRRGGSGCSGSGRGPRLAIRLKVLLSTLLMRNLGRLRCCLWRAPVRLPAAAGSWSLFLSLMLSPSLIAHLLPRLIPTPPPQETTSALRTPFQSNLSFISTVKTCSTRCRLRAGCV